VASARSDPAKSISESLPARTTIPVSCGTLYSATTCHHNPCELFPTLHLDLLPLLPSQYAETIDGIQVMIDAAERENVQAEITCLQDGMGPG